MKRFQFLCALALALSLMSFLGGSATSAPAQASSTTTTFWLQTMDSCRQAIPGASFVLTGNGLNVAAGPGPGTKPKKVGSGSCPSQRGDCNAVSTGCLSWDIPIPASGTAIYKITETTPPANYVYCNGGSVCPGGPEVITLTINSTGAISATTLNTYPDGTTVTYPTSGSPYTGLGTDPAVVHDFQLGNGSCDGDTDADDHLTGGVGSHCDSEKDRP